MDYCRFNSTLFKDCPCKIPDGDEILCNFEDRYWEYKEHGKTKGLLEKVCDSARIEVYCKENNLNLCRGVSIHCSCKVLYEDTFFCNFGNMYAELMFHHKNAEVNILVNSVCRSVRNEIMNHEFFAQESRKMEKTFLEQVQMGDTVYCTTEGEIVILLEKPSELGEKCKYKTYDGLINEEWAFCFRTVSKGNMVSEYRVKDKNYKERTLYLEHLARSNGFRVEKQKLGKSFLLRIFGDIQEKVDDFVSICCINDFVLF